MAPTQSRVYVWQNTVVGWVKTDLQMTGADAFPLHTGVTYVDVDEPVVALDAQGNEINPNPQLGQVLYDSYKQFRQNPAPFGPAVGMMQSVSLQEMHNYQAAVFSIGENLPLPGEEK